MRVAPPINCCDAWQCWAVGVRDSWAETSPRSRLCAVQERVGLCVCARARRARERQGKTGGGDLAWSQVGSVRLKIRINL